MSFLSVNFSNLKRLRLLALPVFLFLIYNRLSAQPYGNEWINYNQSYYKLKVINDGVYRIDYNALLSAGFPVNSIDPRNIQVFGRGQEVSIYINGEGDGSFDPPDYIEFFAKKNDGWLDSRLYQGRSKQPNPYYSLINDTATYFITWNSNLINKRLSLENDVNFSSYLPSPFFYFTSKQDYNTTYFDGETNLGGSTDVSYVPTEGWLDGPINIGGSRIKNIITSNRYLSGPNAEVIWSVAGASNHIQSNPDHHLQVNFASVTYDTLYEGYELLKRRFTVPVSNLGASTTSFNFSSINDIGSGADRSAIGFISISYPHNTDLGGVTELKLSIPDQAGQPKSRFDFTNFNSSGSAILYDLTNNRRISTQVSGTNLQVLVPNSGGDKSCFLVSNTAVKQVTSLKAVNGNGNFINPVNLERDSAFLIIYHPSLKQSASMYASYRSLNGLSAVELNIENLYDQFAFGIRQHPFAIRGAVDFILDNWTDPPDYLFLLGKSVRARLVRKSSAVFAQNLVPTMGNPASDNFITAGLNNTILEPPLATGRLSARSDEEVMWYLNKIKEYESAPTAEWMKTILHFAGGNSEFESNRFSDYLKNFENILEDTLFGGFVHTFKKSTTAPIQITLSDSIAGLINQGAAMMTFFGHASSSGGFDQNIDDPQSYQNKGKYPLLLANSCFAGDIHGATGFSTSEQFVLTSERGMIGFIASTDLGFESLLNLYSENLIRNIGVTNYGGSIGKSMINTVKSIQGDGTNTSLRSTCFEMSLHGDPAISAYHTSKPDYEVNVSSVYFSPREVTTEMDSFEVNIVVKNLGRAIGQQLLLTLNRNFPLITVSDTTYERTIEGVRYRDTITFTLPVDPINGDGLNRFEITVDALSLVDELREDNNFVSVDLFIRSGNLIPVMPYEFAIVPDQNLELIASTGYPFEKQQEYIIELDTTDNFNSPFKQVNNITQEGGVVKWKPLVLANMPQNQVYFWRSSRFSTNPEDINWKESSFQYIKGKRGWSQDHFFQFKNDEFQFLDHNRNNRHFEFLTSLKRLSCVTISSTNLGFLFDVDYKIDANRIEFGGCGLGPAIIVAVLDSLNFEAWGTPYKGQNTANDFGQLNKNGNCGKDRVQKFFIFNANNPIHLSGLKDMLTNKVPDGHYILAYTWVRNDFSKWDAIDPAMRQTFVNLGATKIGQITNDTLPYIFFVQKGNSSTAKEVVGSAPEQFITMNADLQNNTTSGVIRSSLIGPASRWDSLLWDYSTLENPSSDSIQLNLKGVNNSGIETALLNHIGPATKKVDISSVVNSSSNPYLKINARKADEVLQTAPQLDKWQVIYEGVPELAINPLLHFNFHKDTLMEGDLIRFSVAVENISDYDTDSLLISYYVIDQNRVKHYIPYPRQGLLPADSNFITSVEFSTLNLVGLNTFVIEVNPNNDQAEQHHFNNIGQIPFVVISDKSNPLLDVTFDGIRILDGDIVSPKTEIVIQLSDENQFLVLNDTSDFRLWIRDPSGVERPVHFGGNGIQNNIQFIPGAPPKNTAKIIYRPVLKDDGVYKLRVQAVDRSKNESGDLDYEINFEVINRSTITNLINYPNPFTTSTRFVFILTGSKVPDAIQIQIITITGKLVKTIDQYDIGPVNIGRNITQYAWDGRDDYGDRLANGVYLYKVIAQIDGENIEHRSTSADKYFKKGFGKMYLMK